MKRLRHYPLQDGTDTLFWNKLKDSELCGVVQSSLGRAQMVRSRVAADSDVPTDLLDRVMLTRIDQTTVVTTTITTLFIGGGLELSMVLLPSFVLRFDNAANEHRLRVGNPASINSVTALTLAGFVAPSRRYVLSVKLNTVHLHSGWPKLSARGSLGMLT